MMVESVRIKIRNRFDEFIQQLLRLAKAAARLKVLARRHEAAHRTITTSLTAAQHF